MTTLVPLYAWPTRKAFPATWGRVIAAARAHPGAVGVVVNPDSGSGSTSTGGGGGGAGAGQRGGKGGSGVVWVRYEVPP